MSGRTEGDPHNRDETRCNLIPVKVFISWSGETSRKVANALRNWLPQVLQTVEPWLAAADLKPGERVAESMTSNMASASAMILCVTRRNVGSSWVEFEADRAASLGIPVVPICIDLPMSDLGGALLQYQTFTLDRDGTRRLTSALNSVSGSPLNPSALSKLLDIWVPKLVEELKGIDQWNLFAADQGEPQTIRGLMERILAEVEALSVRIASAENGAAGAGVGALNSNEVLAADDTPNRVTQERPKIFIGSSVEGLIVAEHIQSGLNYVAECTVWNQGLFRPSETAIESLIERSAGFDCAIIVLTADDTITQRGNSTVVPRDNLIFELGLFTGFLGRAKTFMVTCRDDDIHLPSDLNGVTALDYPRRSDGNVGAAVAPVCLRIKEVMGLR